MGSKDKRKTKFYAVSSDRVEPTIFDDWAVVHTLVSGTTTKIYKSFPSLEKAKDHMKNKGVMDPRIKVEEGADASPPQLNDETCYAVAHGRDPDIYPNYYNGAEPKVKGVSGNCHKRFRSISEAEAFDEKWKNAIADQYRNAIKKHLDDGIRPVDMDIETRTKNMLLMNGGKKGDTGVLEKMLSLNI